MSTQISDTLLNDIALLEEIVEETTNLNKVIDFFTDVGGVTIERGRIVCYLTDHAVSIELDQTGDELKFYVHGTLSKTQVANGIAEVLSTLADNISAAALEISAIAQTKYP